MAKKKVGKKKVSKKKNVKRKAPKTIAKKISQKPMMKKQVRATPSRIKLVLKNLILFVILSLISYLLYNVSNNEIQHRCVHLFY